MSDVQTFKYKSHLQVHVVLGLLPATSFFKKGQNLSSKLEFILGELCV